MLTNKHNALGIGLVFGFGVLTAAKEVLAANVIQNLPVFHLLFYSFLITLLVANIFYRLSRKGYAVTTKVELKSSILLNIATALSWIGFFYSVKYMEPAIAAAVITSIGPLLVVIIDCIFRKKQSIYLVDLIIATAIGSSVIWLAWVFANGDSGVGKHKLTDTLFALFSALIAGVSFSFSSVYAKKLNDKGWSPFYIMANRYYLLLFIATLFSLWEGGLILSLKNYWGLLLIITFFGVLIPLYMLQFGIRQCDPFVVSLIIALGPVFTLFFESFDQRIIWSGKTSIGISALIMCTLMGLTIQFRRKSNQ
ncbi:MAG: DMT family transporter [Gammaproteobacteria bacterium]|nr:DMT family transporter [Gammaproteobacteria bacterium]